jgi:hypothetical protein
MEAKTGSQLLPYKAHADVFASKIGFGWVSFRIYWVI